MDFTTITEILTSAKCFGFLDRPGFRNLRKAKGLIEEFSEEIFSSIPECETSKKKWATMTTLLLSE